MSIKKLEKLEQEKQYSLKMSKNDFETNQIMKEYGLKLNSLNKNNHKFLKENYTPTELNNIIKDTTKIQQFQNTTTIFAGNRKLFTKREKGQILGIRRNNQYTKYKNNLSLYEKEIEKFFYDYKISKYHSHWNDLTPREKEIFLLDHYQKDIEEIYNDMNNIDLSYLSIFESKYYLIDLKFRVKYDEYYMLDKKLRKKFFDICRKESIGINKYNFEKDYMKDYWIYIIDLKAVYDFNRSDIEEYMKEICDIHVENYMLNFPIDRDNNYNNFNYELNKFIFHHINDNTQSLLKNDLKAIENLTNTIYTNYNQGENSDKFLTLTYKDADRGKNRKRVLEDFRNFRRNVEKYYDTKIKYVAVLEIQEERYEKRKEKVFHLHIILFNFPFVDIKELQNLWIHGNANLKKITEQQNFIDYLAKYVSKDLSERKFLIDNKNNHRYLISKGLNKPIKVLNISNTDFLDKIFSNLESAKQFKTEQYGLITKRKIKKNTKYQNFKISKEKRIKRKIEIIEKIRNDILDEYHIKRIPYTIEEQELINKFINESMELNIDTNRIMFGILNMLKKFNKAKILINLNESKEVKTELEKELDWHIDNFGDFKANVYKSRGINIDEENGEVLNEKYYNKIKITFANKEIKRYKMKQQIINNIKHELDFHKLLYFDFKLKTYKTYKILGNNEKITQEIYNSDFMYKDLKVIYVGNDIEISRLGKRKLRYHVYSKNSLRYTQIITYSPNKEDIIKVIDHEILGNN